MEYWHRHTHKFTLSINDIDIPNIYEEKNKIYRTFPLGKFQLANWQHINVVLGMTFTDVDAEIGLRTALRTIQMYPVQCRQCLRESLP